MKGLVRGSEAWTGGPDCAVDVRPQLPLIATRSSPGGVSGFRCPVAPTPATDATSARENRSRPSAVWLPVHG